MATKTERYVIERTSECMRQWWTGIGWSDDSRDARWYDDEPDAATETDDEEARAVNYPSGEIEAD